MTNMNRRMFLLTSGGLSLSPFAPQNSTNSTDSAGNEVTKKLAHYIVSAQSADLSAAVRKEAARTLLNWAGCTVGGSRHETVGAAVSALAPFSGPAQASILGRHERFDIMNAALINGISSHVLDYDDTHTRNSFHPGRAAQNGLTAAILASKGFTSSERSLEAKYGWVNAVSTAHDYGYITNKLGQAFEISNNTYKPFACGVVMHPTIDGCIQLRNEHNLTADTIDHIELKVHPLVMQLTSRKSPQTGLEGKFSIYHAARITIVQGAWPLDQFSDRAVRDRAVASLRDRVTTAVDSSLHEDQVRIVVTMKNGSRLEKFIEHAVGSLEHPISDKDLETKFA